MRTSRLAIATLAALALCLACAAGPASAKQVYDYVYSGSFIDGTGSEKGPFSVAPADVALTPTGEVLAVVPTNPGYIAKFTPAGASSSFSAPGLSETIVLPRAVGDESELAIDRTAGPGSGNFYLASVGVGSQPYLYGFAADGTPLPGFEFARESLCGVAVAPDGNVWIASRLAGTDQSGLTELSPAGKELSRIESGAACHPAIDAGGNFYAIDKSKKAVKLSPNGEYLYDVSQSTQPLAFAIDPVSDEVLLGTGFAGTVTQYDPLGAKLGSFGAPDPGHSFLGLQGAARGIVVEAASHDVWVANGRDYGSGVRHLERFERSAPITVPSTVTDPPAFAGTVATLQGSVDPDGIETTDCHFDWGTTQALGKTAPCAEGNALSGAEQPVSAQLSSLKKGTAYYFRLSAKNANDRVSTGQTRKFLAQDEPLIESASASQVNTDGVHLNATIDPNGGNTTHRFEWGTDETYGFSSPVSDPFGPVGSDAVSHVITGLAPDTTYHYRVLATNDAGTTPSEDLTFTTYGPDSGTDPCPNAAVRQQTASSLLADCRAYELVSAANAGGYDVESDLIPGQVPLISSPAASDRLLYSIHSGAVPGVEGNPTNFGRDPYLASRGPDGWQTSYVGLPANGMAQKGAFGSPLLESDTLLERFAFGGAGICSPCFADGSTNIPLRSPDGSLQAGMSGSLKPAPVNPSGRVDRHFSADGHHFVFGTAAKLEPLGKNGFATIYERNLLTGTTQVVSTLPNGTAMGSGNAASLDISTDGSRVLVATKVGADAKGNDLWHPYLHIGSDPKSTDLAPGTTTGVHFGGMTADGSRVFMTTTDQLLAADTDESVDVYEAEVDAVPSVHLRLVSVTGSGPSNDDSCEPPGIPDSWNADEGDGKCSALAYAGGAGLAEREGSFYFLSPELLDGPANGEAGEANLYVVRPGQSPDFVATVDSSVGKPGPELGFGLSKAFGSFTGQLFVATDNSGGPSDGDVYVAEVATGLIRKFDPEGNPIASWGDNGVLDGSTAEGGPFGEGVTCGLRQCGIAGIAVDSAGQLVVVRSLEGPHNEETKVFRFAEDGTALSTATKFFKFDRLGIAVDPGNEYIYWIRNYFDDSGRAMRTEPFGADSKSLTFATQDDPPPVTALAVDAASGDLYVGRSATGSLELYSFNEEGKVIEAGGNLCAAVGASSGGGCLPTEIFAQGLTGLSGLAVDAATHHVFVNRGDRVIELDANAEQVGKTFGTGLLSGSSGLAYGQGEGQVYVPTGDSGKVAIFAPTPTAWAPIDDPAILHAVGDAASHRYSDFQVSPDGRYAAFTSAESLKAGFANQGHSEIYRYDAEAGALECASCAPSGAAAESDTTLSPYGLNLSDDGRVFFTSSEPFVLRDANQRKDAYEWSEGEVQLISTGTSPTDSSLLTVSSDGTDAFFFTRQVLVGSDQNGNAVKVYDARAAGGFLRAPRSFPCAASDECHGAGTQPPPPPTINTVTGSGKGPKARPRPCRKGKVKRRGKCVKKARAHRRAKRVAR